MVRITPGAIDSQHHGQHRKDRGTSSLPRLIDHGVLHRMTPLLEANQCYGSILTIQKRGEHGEHECYEMFTRVGSSYVQHPKLGQSLQAKGIPTVQIFVEKPVKSLCEFGERVLFPERIDCSSSTHCIFPFTDNLLSFPFDYSLA